MALKSGKNRSDDRRGLSDMEYSDASGLFVPVGGVKATGKAPVIQADGSVQWQTAGGGGGSGDTITNWDPDKPPTLPNALDVDFSGNSTLSAWPGAWTVAAAGTFDNPIYPNVVPGRLSMKSIGSIWKGYRVAIPAGDFNIAIACATFGIDNDFTLVGLGVSSTTTIDGNPSMWMEMGRRSVWGVRCGIINPSYTVVKAHPSWVVHDGFIMFMRRVGTTYTVGWSRDGRTLVEFVAVPGFVPTFFHVAAYSSQAVADAQQVIRWVRYLPSGVATTYGGPRVLTGLASSTEGITPDTQPTSPNAADDEWESATLDTTGVRRAGATPWAWQNQGAATATMVRGDLNLVTASGGGGFMNARYILEAAPAGDWTYEAKMTILGTRGAGAWSFAGLALRESGTAKANILGVGDDSGVKAQIRRLIADNNWTANPYSSTTDDIISVRTFYAKVARVGSTISWWDSLNGSYYGATLYSAVQTADFTSQPNQVGLAVSAPVGSDVALICHWFRRTA